MRIENVQWLPQFEEKINVKHQLTRSEVEEVLFNRPSVRFVEYGDQAGEDLYAVYGQTFAGRYVTVFFVLKTGNTALVISARDMDTKERKRYGKRK